MKKLASIVLLFTFACVFCGCGGGGSTEPGAVNSGAGGADDPMNDPASDAGVGTDPSLMDPNAAQ